MFKFAETRKLGPALKKSLPGQGILDGHIGVWKESLLIIEQILTLKIILVNTAWKMVRTKKVFAITRPTLPKSINLIFFLLNQKEKNNKNSSDQSIILFKT